MRRVITSIGGTGTHHLRRRTLGVGIVAAAVVAVMIDPGPAEAATIPTPPVNKAVCQPSTAPGNPTMTSFARTPPSVNVTSSGKHITFTIKANDTKNITTISVSVQSPALGPHHVQRGAFAVLKRTGGTAKNGTWQGTAQINKWTNNGTWNITQVFISDSGGGFTFYAPTGFSQKPWNNAWPKTFKVTSKPDVVPPTISSVAVSPGSVDTSSKAKTVGITVKAKDTLSGVAGVFASAAVTIGTRHYSSSFAFLKRTGGSAKNGTYKGKVTVPRWVQKGTHVWTVSVSAGDVATNNVTKNKAKTFKVKSKTDTTKPSLKGLKFTPKSIDVHATPKGKPVSVTLNASDTLSGVSYAFVTFTSPSGFPASGFLTRTAGHPSSGTWKGKVIIPRCSEPGTWTASVTIGDVAGNQVQYTAAQIKAKHFSSTLSVKALDIQPPTATVPAKVPHAGPLVVTFSEATLWAGSSNPLSVSDAATFSTVGGTWTCKNTSGTVVGCNANGANVKTASFAPSSPFTTGHKYNLFASNGIYDTSGNGPTYPFGTFKAT